MNASKFFRLAAIGMACCIGFAACSDSDEPKPGPNPGPDPESNLVLTAQPTTVKAGEEVTFTVTNDGQDVTADSKITSLSEDSKTVTGKWSTEKPGTYKFVAVYGGRTSNEASVTVQSNVQPTGDYMRHVLAMDFTGSQCSACPTMTRMLNAYEKSNPGRLVVIAAHVDIPMSDPLTNEFSRKLMSKFGVNAAPTVWVDYREEGSQNLSTFKAKVNRSINDFPAACGIKLDSKVDGKNVATKATIRFTQTGKYKICAVLLEDNVSVSGSMEGSYNHVLRSYATDVMGDDLGECVEGQEVVKDFSFTAEAGWMLSNCHVAVYVLREEAGSKFYVNNARDCKADGTVDFDYETAE